jgi:hypothetical protein
LVLAALAALIWLAFSAQLGLYEATIRFNRQNPDPYRISYQEPRFREAAALLPLEQPVGYLSNLELNELRGAAAFFGAQYALAPRILIPFPDPRAGRFVVGNFSAEVELSDATSRLAREHNLRVVRAFDNGVVIFENPNRP